ncbi:hypothetical protein SAMN05421830_11430 [Desulfomicrobium norvegicum]|uniref:Uncharacterized protein n=1 Tax=Desulfomicrobium norvegicum (strain DSM 1741 / NCIMB 8310) TaxID=52561 RepID=A0A8G2FFN2_DESNO|nr:hypothetical protein SAMN05421830_11430 [Desulfomicrobium norvegicum]
MVPRLRGDDTLFRGHSEQESADGGYLPSRTRSYFRPTQRPIFPSSHPTPDLSFVPPNARSERVGRSPARVVDCPTEPGIVCFPAVSVRSAAQCLRLKAGKHYEAGKGVSTALAGDRPARDRTDTAPSRPGKDLHRNIATGTTNPPDAPARAQNYSPCTNTRSSIPIFRAMSAIPPNARSERVGRSPARAVDCLTEPGIVCFPAVSRSKRRPMPKTQGREALRGRRGSFDGPRRRPPGTRPH